MRISVYYESFIKKELSCYNWLGKVYVEGKTSLHEVICKTKDLTDFFEELVNRSGNILTVAFVDDSQVENIRRLYEEAREDGRNYINIDNSLITEITFKREELYTTFPEKQEKERLIKQTAKETLLTHLNIEKQLNIELI